MRMTISRWAIGVALACAAVAALVLPFPPTEPRAWTSAAPGPLTRDIAQLVRASTAAYTAVRRFRSMQGIERWKRAAVGNDTTLIRVDASVPAAAQAAVRAVATEQWATLIPRASAARAEIFVYVDSSSITRAAGAEAGRRALEPRRFVDVSFALPEALDGGRCVTIVRLRGTSPAHLNALRNESLVGVCAFFAAFGEPGEGVRSWLGAQRYRFARRSDWNTARAPTIDASSLYALGEHGGRCLTGDALACDSALGFGPSSPGAVPLANDRLAAVVDAARPGGFSSGYGLRTLGDAEDEFLADLVRDLGPERFAQFWRSDLAPPAAFVAATGESFSAWTRRWLARAYGPAPERPAPRLRDVIWLALAMPIGLLVASRPRDTVLSDRMRSLRV